MWFSIGLAVLSFYLWARETRRRKDLDRELRSERSHRELADYDARMRIEALISFAIEASWHRQNAEVCTYAELNGGQHIGELAMEYAKENPERRQWLIELYAWNEVFNQPNRGPWNTEVDRARWKAEAKQAELVWAATFQEQWGAAPVESRSTPGR